MGEFSLLSKSDLSKEAYRFLWLRSFHHPIAVRIERSSNKTDLFFTELNGAGAYEPGTILSRERRSIDHSQWCEFLNKLEKANYWDLGEDRDDTGDDGSQWVMEGVRDGRYHLVDRWTPIEGDYRLACIFLLQLSGLDTDRLGGDLY